jgi:ribosomal protein L1
MAITKKRKAASAKVDKNKFYTLKEASSLVKEVNTTKFDASSICMSVWVWTRRRPTSRSAER